MNEARRALVLWSIFSAKAAYQTALHWQAIPEVVKDCMTEYHVHVAIAYALNEALAAGVDVYGLLHDD